MPHIEVRLKAGVRDPGDLLLSVQERTFNYLIDAPAKEIRISAYLDRDWPVVLPMYAEVFVCDESRYHSRVVRVLAGSRTRPELTLPGPMMAGEQLTIVVARTPLEGAEPA